MLSKGLAHAEVQSEFKESAVKLFYDKVTPLWRRLKKHPALGKGHGASGAATRPPKRRRRLPNGNEVQSARVLGCHGRLGGPLKHDDPKAA
jgi:hypothetical protein